MKGMSTAPSPAVWAYCPARSPFAWKIKTLIRALLYGWVCHVSAKGPSGVTVQLGRSRKNRYFRWTKATCSTCPLREQCVSSRVSSKTLVLHPYHEEIQVLRARWENPEFRERYRLRSQVERLVNESVRRGCRRARAWGVRAASLQAHIAAAGTNLVLLAKALTADGACAQVA
jgi:hypothetical protein